MVIRLSLTVDRERMNIFRWRGMSVVRSSLIASKEVFCLVLPRTRSKDSLNMFWESGFSLTSFLFQVRVLFLSGNNTSPHVTLLTSINNSLLILFLYY